MNIIRDTYIGAITAISYSPDSNYIVFGSGKSIWIYSNLTFQCIHSIPALQNATIHGIRFHGDFMCVFGKNEFVLYHWSELVERQFSGCHPFYQNNHFVDWIWDICIIVRNDNSIELAIGTAHNTVVMWNVAENCHGECYYGKDRCILYSMSILNRNGELLVASGTVFTEVHVWSPQHPGKIHVCKSHEGVIFKLCWNTDGRYLLSVSDDRALIAWRHSISDSAWCIDENISCSTLMEGSYSPLFRAYGHTARLWDCLFTPKCIVTCAEDCSLRFWNEKGACIAAFGGHKGKHVWCVAYDSQHDIAVSGGNDGAVKIWDIASIIESYQETSIRSFQIPSIVDGSSTEARTSKSECIRDISVAADGNSIFVASNWGFVWTFDLLTCSFKEVIKPASQESVSTMSISSDNEIVASGDYNGNLRIVSLSKRFEAKFVEVTQVRISRILFSKESASAYFLFVIAADGTIFIYSLNSENGDAQKLIQLHCTSKGAITSLLWNSKNSCLCVGDSVGCVHFVQLSQDGSNAMSIVKETKSRCHGHSPICVLSMHEDMLWTGGHDGRIVPLFVLWDTLEVNASTPISVPQMKQIMSLWWTEAGELCCAGFHETDYIVFDITNTYEVLRLPAGGWKRPFSSYHDITHPFKGYVFAYASTNGFTNLCVFQKRIAHDKHLQPALCVPSHGRELDCVHWIEASEDSGILATGGEDRKLQLVKVTKEDGTFHWNILHSFETHSSSIRALCSCVRNDGRGYYLFSCGGRNTICMWSIDRSSLACQLLSQIPVRDASNSVEGGDQRIMDAKVVRLAKNVLMLCIGDSCGRMVTYVIREDAPIPIVLNNTEIHSTPILSIEIASVLQQTFVIAGTAAGDIMTINITEEMEKGMKEVQLLSTAEIYATAQKPTHVFSFPADAIHSIPMVHAMGVNDLEIAVQDDKVVCFTVGDDQTIRATTLQLDGLSLNKIGQCCVEGASGTSLRGLFRNGNDLFITGWEQHIQRWRWENNQLVRTGRYSVQVPETGYIDGITSGNSILCAVCGVMGFEVLEIGNLNVC